MICSPFEHETLAKDARQVNAPNLIIEMARYESAYCGRSFGIMR